MKRKARWLSVSPIVVAVALLAGVLALMPIAPAAAQGPEADYGDAPDPSYPSLYNTASTTYAGRRGPYHLDVTQEWIGSSLPSSTTTTELDANVIDLDFDDGLVQLERALLGGVPLLQGYVTVPITIGPGAEAVRYLNVAADLNQDGVWKAYSVGALTQQEWVVANLAIFTEPGTSVNVIVPFYLVDPSVDPPDLIWTRATLTTEYIDPDIFGPDGWDGSGPDGGFSRGETEDWEVEVSDLPVLISPSGRLVNPLPPVNPPPPPPGGDPTPAPKEPEKGKEKEGVPDITQKDAECGPTSITNSLYYLCKAGAFPCDKLPTNPTDLIEALKKAMQDPWTGLGVSDGEFIAGKKKIIGDLELPIDMHCQNDDDPKNPKIPTKEFIMKELDKCEDVELGMTFTDADGGGHWVSLVGYTLYPDGKMRLKIHDPDESAKVGDEYYWVGGPDMDGYLYLKDYGRPNKVDIVCAESPVKRIPAVTGWSIMATLATLVASGLLLMWRRRAQVTS